MVATSHSFKPSVKAWAKQTYREHAAGDAKLWLVPANLSSYRDVDALVTWVGNVQKKTSGATTTILKPAYEPSLFFPFAAPPVHGSLADSGELFESQARLMLWGSVRLPDLRRSVPTPMCSISCMWCCRDRRTAVFSAATVPTAK